MAVFGFDRVLASHFVAPHHPTLHPYRSACGIGVASKKQTGR